MPGLQPTAQTIAGNAGQMPVVNTNTGSFGGAQVGPANLGAFGTSGQPVSSSTSSYTKSNLGAQQTAGIVPMQGTGKVPEYAQPANEVGGFQTAGFQYGAAPSGDVRTDYIQPGEAPVGSVGQQPTYMQNMQDAYIGQANSRLDPQWQQRQSDLETQLANQGLSRGSPAWDREMQNFQRGRNDAYQSAMNAGILTSGAEAQRAQGMDIAGGTFANQAAQQNYLNKIGSQQAANQAQGQQFGQNLQSAQLNNAALSAQQAAGQGWGQIEANKAASAASLAGQQAMAGAQVSAAQMQAALGQRQLENAERLQDYQMGWDMQFKPYELQNLAMQGMIPGNPSGSFGGFQNMGVDTNYAANLNRGNDQITNAIGNAGQRIDWGALGGNQTQQSYVPPGSYGMYDRGF